MHRNFSLLLRAKDNSLLAGVASVDVAPASARPGATSVHRSRRNRWLGLLVGVLLLAVISVLSIVVGAKDLPVSAVLSVLFSPDSSEASEIVHSLRVPRTVIGLVAGTALAVAGALMQALTRNPLADPGLLGVNAGAGLAVALGIALLGLNGADQYSVVAFIGAVVATLLVLAVGRTGRYGASPARLVLSGVALAAIFAGISMALTMSLPQVFAGYRSWTVGSLVGRDLTSALPVLPVVAAAAILAVCLGPALGALSLGEDHARALGTKIRRVRGLGLLAITVLAGCATALMGPVVFLGLMIPHIVRRFTGPNQTWIIASCIVYGPTVLLTADILGRVIARPGEYPVGFMTALIGAPMLIALMLRRRVMNL